MKLVLASRYDIFWQWCIDNGIDPRGREIKYVHQEKDMLGFKPEECEIIQIGEWFKGKSFEVFSDINYRIFAMSLTGAKVSNVR